MSVPARVWSVWRALMACTLALCGEKERALAELRKFFRAADPASRPSWPLRDPDLESLRDLPEFQAIFARAMS